MVRAESWNVCVFISVKHPLHENHRAYVTAAKSYDMQYLLNIFGQIEYEIMEGRVCGTRH
jgi:hypothetical protein